MGTSTSIRDKTTKNPFLVRLPVDPVFTVVVVFLLVFGLLMVYSASWEFAYSKGSAGFVLMKQLRWVFLGGVVAYLNIRLGYQFFKSVAIYLILGLILMLLAVLLIGEVRFGSTRTLLQGSGQPSEFAKMGIIIYLAVWCSSKGDKLNDVRFGLIPLMVILGVTAFLVFAQPDYSATASIIVLGGLMFYLADGNMKQIVLVVVFTVVVALVIFSMTQTGRARMGSFLGSIGEPENASYHIKRSLEAIVRGGLFGVGIGKGTAKFTGLPVAWTDSIFAVIVEETGLAGAAVVVLLYMVFLWRGLKIAHEAADKLGKLLASGLTVWIVMEAVINMGVMVNLLPVAGNALPLISFGGSSMLTTMMAIGVIMSVSRGSYLAKAEVEGRLSGAFVDLRRRDGGRGLSRSGRFASTKE